LEIPEDFELRRPPNPYLLYNKEKRSQVQLENPFLSVGEINRILSSRWKRLSETDRSKYESESKKLKSAWLSKGSGKSTTKKGYNNVDKQSANEINEDSVKDVPVKRKKRKTVMKDPNQPKHPMSAFLFYLSEVRPSYTAKYPGWTVGPISKMISQAWKALTDSEKEKYISKAYDDKIRYAREMENFLSNREQKSSFEMQQMSKSPQAYCTFLHPTTKHRSFLSGHCRSFSLSNLVLANSSKKKTNRKKHTNPSLLISSPLPISNIRLVKVLSNDLEYEYPAEIEWRLKREQIQRWHHEYWSYNNARFEAAKKAFENSIIESHNRPITDHELSTFYSFYIVSTRSQMMEYNSAWWGHNFEMLRFALISEISRVIRLVRSNEAEKIIPRFVREFIWSVRNKLPFGRELSASDKLRNSLKTPGGAGAGIFGIFGGMKSPVFKTASFRAQGVTVR
ncbi:hypothetical protein HK096_000027, partial [Nowakowskiella sp. JEL0078]